MNDLTMCVAGKFPPVIRPRKQFHTLRLLEKQKRYRVKPQILDSKEREVGATLAAVLY